MKKFLVLVSVVIFIFGFAGLAGAYFEEYTPIGGPYSGQPIHEGESYNFWFDFRYLLSDTGLVFGGNLNAPAAGTDSTYLYLSADSDDMAVDDPWTDASVAVSLYSGDAAEESTRIKILAYTPWTEIEIAEIEWNGQLGDGNYLFEYDFTEDELVDLWKYSKVKVVAYWDGAPNNINNFRIDKVAMGVNEVAPVPEPATMLLLGSGLIGLATFRRKFIKR